MKVLHLTTSLGGGAGIASVRVNNALKSIGVESTILSRNSFDGSHKLSSVLRLVSSTNTFLQSRIVQKSHDLVTPLSVNVLDIKSKILDSADIIHVHSYYNLLNVSLLKAFVAMHKPIFFTLHDQRLFTGGCHYSRDCSNYLRNCSHCPQVKTPFQFLVKSSFINQESIFTNSNNIELISPSIWLKNVAKESKILSKIPIRVLKNPIPKIFFEYPINVNKKADTIRIAFIAAHIDNPYKGLNIFIKAVNTIASLKNAKITIVLIGEGGDVIFNPSVQIERSTVDSDVKMAEILSTVDLLVVPSSQDNSPSVISEALCMGITVLGSRTGGITEILDEFRMPTFTVGDYGQLASKIMELTEFKRKEEIREQSKAYFSEEIIAKKLYEIYKEAIIKYKSLH
jgi:glycosyltransferase involved in cell wall biosynthesis